MEVLKQGSVPPPQAWTDTITCAKDDEHDKKDGCGAQLKVGLADLVPKYWEGTHTRKYYAVVECPFCAKQSRARLPDAVWKLFFTKEKKAEAAFDGFRG